MRKILLVITLLASFKNMKSQDVYNFNFDNDGSSFMISHDINSDGINRLDLRQVSNRFLKIIGDTLIFDTWTIKTGDVAIWNSASTLYKSISYVPTWTDITSKPSFATVAVSGSYLDLTNKPTIPTVSGSTGTFGIVTTSNGLVTSGKRIETYSGTTNSSGVYTVTFGTAYSVTPNIQVSITNQGSTNQYIRISSVSTTGFTINAYQFNTNTLLGIVSLVSSTSNINGATIDVLITEK